MRKITVELTEEIIDEIVLESLKQSYEFERFNSLFDDTEQYSKSLEQVLKYYMPCKEFDIYIKSLEGRV